MNLNFQNFKPVLTANTRDNSHLLGKGQGQNFTLKFRKFVVKKKGEADTTNTKFTLSNKKFAELDLENKGITEFVNEGKSYLGVVDNENAVFYKRNKKNEGVEKGKDFKSTILESSLSKEGLINLDLVGTNQKLTLTLVEGSEQVKIGDIQTYGIYEIGKDESVDTEEDKQDSEQEDTVQDEVDNNADQAPVNDVPQGTAPETPVANPEASATPTVEDDF